MGENEAECLVASLSREVGERHVYNRGMPRCSETEIEKQEVKGRKAAVSHVNHQPTTTVSVLCAKMHVFQRCFKMF